MAIYHGLLASCLLGKKRIHAAEYELNLALQLEPTNVDILLTQARMLLLKNSQNKAIECCNEILSIDPESTGALLLKATVLFIKDKQAERLECLQQALTLNPESALVITALGDFYHDTGDNKKAFDIAQDALAADPENIDANVLMGNVQLALGNTVDAEYHAMFAISHNPDSEEALMLFSNIKMRKNLFLGCWWRFNNKVASMGNLKSSFVLVFAYLIFSLIAQILFDFGYVSLSSLTSNLWLGLVIYSWVCLPIYYKQLEKELRKFRFNSEF